MRPANRHVRRRHLTTLAIGADRTNLHAEVDRYVSSRPPLHSLIRHVSHDVDCPTPGALTLSWTCENFLYSFKARRRAARTVAPGPPRAGALRPAPFGRGRPRARTSGRQARRPHHIGGR